MRFSVNLSLLFQEVPFLERFERARAAGFGAVEFWWPSGIEPAEVERAAKAAGVQVILMNFDAGDMRAGDRGLLSDPGRFESFTANVPVALELASNLGCRMLNALVGLRLPGYPLEEQLQLARHNVGWAAGLAAQQDALILLEAVNPIENGPYLLTTVEEAAAFARTVDVANLKLQCDLYHMQRTQGNLVPTLRAHLPEIAHVQLADAPGRGEPGTGEIRFAYVLNELEALGYSGHVGLEYRPSAGHTEASLAWLPATARAGDFPASSLVL